MNAHTAKAVRRKIRQGQADTIRQFMAVTLAMTHGERIGIAVDLATRGHRWAVFFAAAALFAVGFAAGVAL